MGREKGKKGSDKDQRERERERERENWSSDVHALERDTNAVKIEDKGRGTYVTSHHDSSKIDPQTIGVVPILLLNYIYFLLFWLK